MAAKTLTLTELNDYLAPSQICIRPVEVTNEEEKEQGVGQTEIVVDSSTSEYYELSLPSNLPSTLNQRNASLVNGKRGAGPEPAGVKKALKKAEISLNDCLACSGCITTSQELLLQTHSLNPLLEILPEAASVASIVPVSTDGASTSTNPTKTPFLSLSPQSLASIASTSLNPPSLSILLHRIRSFLLFQRPDLGILHVTDTTFARHISLSETLREFTERKGAGGVEEGPILASACPGWVCYVEKAHPQVLGRLSSCVSQEAGMGRVVKGHWARENNLRPEQIYHISVQPCYDRKLEASRTQFLRSQTASEFNPATADVRVPEIDLVLTTGEFYEFIQERGFELDKSVDGEEFLPPAIEGLPASLVHQGSSSDSYIHTLLNTIIASQPSSSKLKLTTTPIRSSSDYIEYTLSSLATQEGKEEVIFKGAKCYGFKNLQNVVRKAKGKGLAKGGGYDYVEVMACPGGCVNGGGQMKPISLIDAEPKQWKDAEGFTRPWEKQDVLIADPVPVTEEGMRWSTKSWVKRVEEVYWNRVPVNTDIPEEKLVKVVQEFQGGERGDRDEQLVRADEIEKTIREEEPKDWLRTTFEAVGEEDPIGGGLGVVW